MNEQESRVRVVDEGIRFLSHFPEIPWTIENGALEVPPENSGGYRIALEDGDTEATLWCHYWHEHFSNAEECLKVFKGLFERTSRVVASRRGDSEHAWSLEVLVDGKWHALGTTGLLLVAFWKRKKAIYYVNRPRVPSSASQVDNSSPP